MRNREYVGTKYFIVETEPQQEARCAAFLIGWKVATNVYLPTFTKEVTCGRRIQQRQRPMFPGYLFISDTDRLDRIRGTPGARKLLILNGEPATLYESEVKIIREEEARIEDSRLNPIKPPRFRKGEVVRVIDGLFVGFTAEVDRLDDGERITLLFEILGGRRRAQIPLEMCAPL